MSIFFYCKDLIHQTRTFFDVRTCFICGELIHQTRTFLAKQFDLFEGIDSSNPHFF